MVQGFLPILVIMFVVVLKDDIYNDLLQNIPDPKNKILAITLRTIYFLGGRDGGVGGGGVVDCGGGGGGGDCGGGVDCSGGGGVDCGGGGEYILHFLT